MSMQLGTAVLALLIWVYLIAFRGGFWRANHRDDSDNPPEPAVWPRVTAVIPARNEADVVEQSLSSLLSQDYPGPFSIILVDDQSDDGTAEAARRAGGAEGRLTIISGAPLRPGWTGKLWAMAQGVAHASTLPELPRYVLLTDADIAYAPDALRSLVARAEAGGLVLTSLMARLRCESLAEQALIPAFVFFFQMLYPFRWVSDQRKSNAGAAGGCMLADANALAAAGGIGAIRDALIDDCTLGALLKLQGPIWLGLTERVRSLRAYPVFDDIRRMVSRSAYAQLGYSPILLAGTLAGMVLTYLAAPAIALFGSGVAQVIAAACWVLMAVAFWPILRFYRVSRRWAPALPLIAAAYTAFTLDSAWQHWRGRGGMWKGRAQAMAKGKR